MTKKLNVLTIVFAALVAVGLILAIVGMCTGVVSLSGESDSMGLFDKEWEMLDTYGPIVAILNITVPSRAFTVIAFVVAFVGIVIALTNGVLGLFDKDVNILGFVGGAVAIVGGILVLVAGLVLAGQFNSFIEDTAKLAESMNVAIRFPEDTSFSAGVGIWLGAVGSIIAGVAGLLGGFKIGRKAK